MTSLGFRSGVLLREAILPYYLLIVADPVEVSFRFQVELDVQFAVGRIFFETEAEYRAYANSVVKAETEERATSSTLRLVATSNTPASRLLFSQVATPLSAALARSRPSSRIGTVSEHDANKERLVEFLRGGFDAAEVLAIFAEGVGYPNGDPRQAAQQGAVVTNDWDPKLALVDQLHLAAAGDLEKGSDSASPFVLLFSDYSAGTVEFEVDPGANPAGPSEPKKIASRPFISALSQSLLTNGARAVVGLIGRRVSSDASWNGAGLNVQIFDAVLKLLLDGYPIGWAMERFGAHYADQAAALQSMREDQAFFRESDIEIFRELWHVVNDLAHLILLGDPAARVTGPNLRTLTADGDEGRVPEIAPRSEGSAALGNIAGANPDAVAKTDSLQFRSHVFALADLIDSPETLLPLTIGIFGPWGSGKSSLLELLVKEIGEGRLRPARPKEEIPSPTIHPIRFNAWEYSASEVVWPALARKIVDELERFLGVRWYGRKLLRNLKRQFSRDRGWVALGGIGFVAAIAALALDSGADLRKFWEALLAVGGIGLIKLIYDSVNNSFGQWLTSLFQGRAYGQPLDFFDQIKEEFSSLNSKLKEKNARTLVTIDDLDRCEPTKAIEVLQAIHLLLRFERMIVCIALDPRLVVCAIEKHFEGLLGEVGASGLEYLDKIIQIPVRIPEPQSEEVRNFLATLVGNPEPPRTREPAVPTSLLSEDLKARPQAGDRPAPDAPPLAKTSTAAQQESSVQDHPSPRRIAFSWEEAQTFEQLASFLRPNPRHLKRLVNVYRLVRSVAAYGGGPSVARNPRAMIGWLAISSQWPTLAYQMAAQVHKLRGLRVDDPDYVLPTVNPLLWVFNKVRDSADQIKTGPRDGSLEELTRLVAYLTGLEEPKLEWIDLWRILRFTTYFNPAIEFDWGPTWLESRQESAPNQPSAEGEASSLEEAWVSGLRERAVRDPRR
jgi:hypothetical protein